MKPEFDIVVHGATGFTGRLVCEHLVKTYRNGVDIRWAMAGRNYDRLVEARNVIGAPEDTPLIVADSNDLPSIEALVRRTDTVIATAGPFVSIGEPLVAACASNGNGYVDLTGDAAWVRKMIDAYEVRARNSGAHIIFSAGFDSVPSDLGLLLFQRVAKETFGAPIERVRGYVRDVRGSLSGGTVESAKASAAIAREDDEILALLRNPFALASAQAGPEQPSITGFVFDEAAKEWVAPFIMSGINTKTVHRSNELQGYAYGSKLIYDEVLVLDGCASESDAARTAEESCWSNRAAIAVSPLRSGDGPSKSEREAGGYMFQFIGAAADGNELRVSVTGDRDPGYGSTSKIIAETALCLRDAREHLAGGIWTPGSLLGEGLIDRLEERAGLTFEVEHSDKASIPPPV